MRMDIFLQKMDEAGDAYVYYRSAVSNKQKYHICTLDISNCKYIIDKALSKGITRISDVATSVKAFCWDLDDFKNIDVSQVVSVVPLNTVLR